MYYVYALQSMKDRRWLYIGSTDDLPERFTAHQKGKVTSTSKYLPLRLVYYEAYLEKKDATQREYQLKNNHQQKEQLKEMADKKTTLNRRICLDDYTPITSILMFRLKPNSIASCFAAFWSRFP